MSSKTALIVIDMQTCFHTIARYPPLSDTVIPNIKSIISIARANNLHIIYTQHGHSESAFLGPSDNDQDNSINQLVKRWGHEHSLHTDTPDWELMDEIADDMRIGKAGFTNDDGGTCEIVISKDSYDAFVRTELEERLKSMKVGKVIICGVLTNLCVEDTARGAFNREFDTWIVRDACSAASKELHENALNTFSHAYGEVVSTERMLKEIECGLTGYLQDGSEEIIESGI